MQLCAPGNTRGAAAGGGGRLLNATCYMSLCMHAIMNHFFYAAYRMYSMLAGKPTQNITEQNV